MLIQIFWHIILYSSCDIIFASIFESSTTTESLIKNYGYPFEQYEIKTADDYFVKLFRIPYSPKNQSKSEDNTEKPVVLLVHGFAQSSADWVLSGSPRSLGFLLADKGYDVWLANPRGTRYSKKHARLSTFNPAFWRFSWHEIGIYDLPAFINYILAKTSSSKIQYIGHSQGTTAYFVAASTVNGFNELIESAYLFAPVTFISHATASVLPPLALFFGHPNVIAAYGDFEVFPNRKLNQILSDTFCADTSPVKQLCLDLSYLIYGWGSKETNTTALKILFETAPAGVSIKQVFHFLQLYNSEKFRQFDYGFFYNNFEYHQSTPPDYQLSNVTAPVFIYHSENDALGDPTDINILAKSLPSGTIKKMYKMPSKDWNHIDFLIAYNVDERLYSIVLEDMKKI